MGDYVIVNHFISVTLFLPKKLTKAELCLGLLLRCSFTHLRIEEEKRNVNINWKEWEKNRGIEDSHFWHRSDWVSREKPSALQCRGARCHYLWLPQWARWHLENFTASASALRCMWPLTRDNSDLFVYLWTLARICMLFVCILWILVCSHFRYLSWCAGLYCMQPHCGVSHESGLP